MITLTGYQISEQIHQSQNSLVYRGYRESDHLLVIIKVLRENYPTPTQLTRYQQEYQLTHNLELQGVVKAHSLETYQNTLAILFEDFGGTSLKILSQAERINLKDFLLNRYNFFQYQRRNFRFRNPDYNFSSPCSNRRF